MREVEIGSFTAAEKDGFFVVSHKNMDYELRIAATETFFTRFFESVEEEEQREAYSLAFASISLFSRMALQDFRFLGGFVSWYTSEVTDLKEVSEEEDAKVLKDQQQLYELQQEAAADIMGDGAEPQDSGL